MPTYHPRADADVHSEPSPVDPWGLLDPREKARAAILHADLLRNPATPYERPATPPPPERELIVGVCALRNRRRGHTVLTHTVIAPGLSSVEVGSHLCIDCAQALPHGIRARSFRIGEVPNPCMIDTPDGRVPTWGSGVAGLWVSLLHPEEHRGANSFVVRHWYTHAIIDGDQQRVMRYTRFPNAVQYAQQLGLLHRFTDETSPTLTWGEFQRAARGFNMMRD
jgi:hypothetical protein